LEHELDRHREQIGVLLVFRDGVVDELEHAPPGRGIRFVGGLEHQLPGLRELRRGLVPVVGE
jgi:hypothetical protein